MFNLDTLASFGAIAKPQLINNTITENASQYGGGIYNRSSNTTVINTILWENEASGISHFWRNYGSFRIC